MPVHDFATCINIHPTHRLVRLLVATSVSVSAGVSAGISACVGAQSLFCSSRALAQKPPVISPTSPQPTPLTIRLSRKATPQAISPYIYGFGSYMKEDRTEAAVWSLRPSVFRWGGNTTDRFNWKVNAWNTGEDWYFKNVASRIPNVVDTFVAQNNAANVASAITLPLLGYVAKDADASGFPVSVYGPQESADGDAGSGIDLKGRRLVSGPERTSIPAPPAFLAEWVRHLQKGFGKGPHIYILGNEPGLWFETHRDAHPAPATYDEVRDKFLAAAEAVRKADPKAVIVGPAAWGWLEIFQSAYDMPGPWNGNKAGLDKKNHGGKPFLEWFLAEIARREKETGLVLLDVLDVHYYPEGNTLRNGKVSSPENRKLRLQATRSLWDRTYTDQSWIDDTIYLIPRLKEMAAKVRPSLKVSLGEYNFRGENDVAGGLAQAEALGVFATEGLHMAHYWTIPPAESAPWMAFKLFRNPDGKGKGFESLLLDNSAGVQDELSVYASESTDGKRVTVVILNKSLTRTQSFALDTSSLGQSFKLSREFWFDEDFKQGLQSRQFKAKAGQKMGQAGGLTEIQTSPLSAHFIELVRE